MGRNGLRAAVAMAAYREPSAVGQKVLLDIVAVGLEQHVGAAQLADLLFGPLDHAVALAGLGVEHLPAAGNLEALLGTGFGLDLGHLALLYRTQSAGRSARRAGDLLETSVLIEHFAAATAALVSRAAGGRGYGRGARRWQLLRSPIRSSWNVAAAVGGSLCAK